MPVAGPRILFGIPADELLFAFGYGLYGSGFPEQVIWSLSPS